MKSISTIIANAKKSVKTVFNRIKAGFNEIDKIKHFTVGFAISFAIGMFFPWLGILAALIAGVAKEYWDSKGHGTVDWYDCVFTLIGGICAFPLALVVSYLHCLFIN